MTNTLGHNLKKIRKESNMTLDELSKAISISITDINAAESNKKDIPISVLLKYSKYFNISLDDLCNISINKQNEKVFLEKLDYIAEKYNLDLSSNETINLIVGCVKLLNIIKDFDESKKAKVLILYKLFISSNFSEEQFNNIVEIFTIFKFNNEDIFTNDELMKMLEVFEENSKYNLVTL